MRPNEKQTVNGLTWYGRLRNNLAWIVVTLIISIFLVLYLNDFVNAANTITMRSNRTAVISSPAIIGIDSDISIRTVSLVSDSSTRELKILVFGPNMPARSVNLYVGNETSFPDDFGVLNIQPGQYFISALEVDRNASIGTQSFKVSSFPPISHLFSFVSSPIGITLIGGVTAALVGAFYQERSGKRELSEIFNYFSYDPL